jgi:hypothetical protein
MDPRLRLAVDASLAWYDDIFALHGLPAGRSELLWHALAAPPPYHSTVKTVVPGVSAQQVLEACAPFDRCSVADSFGDLVLPGFSLLFEAVWLHAPGGRSVGLPPGWSVVSRPETLTLWSTRHDYVGVLTADVLHDRRFTVLGRFHGDALLGGAVLHDGADAVGLSNSWSEDALPLDMAEVLEAARAIHPHRAVTDYAHGDGLPLMLAAGFEPVGTQRVWVR